MFSSIVSHPNRACSEVTVLFSQRGKKNTSQTERALKTENHGNHVIHNIQARVM